MAAPPAVPFLPRRVPIDGYGEKFFHFSGMSHAGSVLALPSGIHAWDVADMKSLDETGLAPILAEADAFELLLLGTGRDPAREPASADMPAQPVLRRPSPLAGTTAAAEASSPAGFAAVRPGLPPAASSAAFAPWPTAFAGVFRAPFRAPLGQRRGQDTM